MRRVLPDVNVLLALIDTNHAFHEQAQAWMSEAGSWASCAITQNGFVRILSQPGYPSPRTPTTAIALLASPIERTDHEFWPCDITLADRSLIDATQLLGPSQLTDVYLLALAVAHGGRLVTFDGSIRTDAVKGATQEHLVVL